MLIRSSAHFQSLHDAQPASHTNPASTAIDWKASIVAGLNASTFFPADDKHKIDATNFDKYA
jgi:hypothetical protein